MGLITKFRHVKSSLSRYASFGHLTAFRLSIISHFVKDKSYEKRIIYKYLEKYLSTVPIESVDSSVNDEIINEGPIWFCWWQGMGAMPPVVKMCWEHLDKIAVKQDIVFVDKDNYSQYCSLNRYIIDKFKRGKISLAHFSDIIRFNLLYRYGGVWLDATVIMNEKAIPYLSQPFFTVSIAEDDRYISGGRWSGFLIGGRKDNPLFKYIVDCYNYYWREKDTVIDYFLMDYIIAIACKRSAYIDKLICSNAVRYDNLYYLQDNYQKKHKDIPDELRDRLLFSKLTWKI